MWIINWAGRAVVVLLKLRIVFLEAVFCTIPAIMTWYFVLGADPRVDGENRQLVPILAAVAFTLLVGVWLFWTGRFRPSPWLYVRAAQLSAGISLIQLSHIQTLDVLRWGLLGLGLGVVGAGLLAMGRVLWNRKPWPIIDVALVYGTLAAALIAAGSYHARTLDFKLDFAEPAGVATLDKYQCFGLVHSDHKSMTDIRKWEHGFVIDGGHGIELIDGAGRVLLVPGEVNVPSSICYRLLPRLPDMLEKRTGSFAGSESHVYLFWVYLAAAGVFLVVGFAFDQLSKTHSLTPDGEPDKNVWSLD